MEGKDPALILRQQSAVERGQKGQIHFLFQILLRQGLSASSVRAIPLTAIHYTRFGTSVKGFSLTKGSYLPAKITGASPGQKDPEYMPQHRFIF